jgi:hypothetical protein
MIEALRDAPRHALLDRACAVDACRAIGDARHAALAQRAQPGMDCHHVSLVMLVLLALILVVPLLVAGRFPVSHDDLPAYRAGALTGANFSIVVVRRLRARQGRSRRANDSSVDG